jgi:cytoskeletal protein CcmA (bactofilin family)
MSTVRIQLRRGLASEWTSADTALNASGGLRLAAGEVGLETDTGTFKFGDGTTRWSELPYALENTLGDYVLVSEVGVANGVASLNSSGKVPSSQLDISELSQDAVNTALVAGTGISKTYDDNANTITLAVNATTSNITEGTNLYFTDERAQDAVNTAIVAGTNIARSYDDNANTITISMPNDIILSGYVDANQILGNSGAIDGELTAGSLTVSGNLTVNGTTTTVNSTSLVVDDPIIKIADGNAANSVDIGFAGSRTISGTYSHTGLVKDATDGIWKLFSGVATEPGSTVDFTTWTKDDLSVGDVYSDEVFIGATQISTELAAKASSSSLTTHINDTLNVHGITNTANLAYTAGPTFTGTVVLPSTTSIGDVSSTEIGQLNGVTSSIQNQLNDKLNSSTAASTYAPLTDASINGATFTGTVVLPSTTSIAEVSATEIGYLNGVTSAIQTQLTQKTTDLDNHALDTTSIHGIADTAELATKTYADSAVSTHQSDSTNIHGIADTANLVTLAGTQTLTNKTIALGSNTVSGTKAQFNSAMTDADFATLAGTETLTNKTITSPAGLVKADVGLGNVDNTSDAGKPVSTATQTALNLKANLNAPTFTGTVTSTNDLVVDGNLTVNGTTFSASSTSITIEDNMVQLAHQNSANTVDLGLVVAYNDGTAKHSGLVRDVSEDEWKLFKGVTTEPTTTVNFGQGSLDNLELNNLVAAGVVFTDGTQTKEGVASRTPIIQKTAEYTLSALTERDSLIEVSHTGGTAVKVLIPTDATLNYPIGTSIDILRTNTGAVTIEAVTPGTTTVNATPGLKLRAQWSSATLFKRAANTWVVMGDLSA